MIHNCEYIKVLVVCVSVGGPVLLPGALWSQVVVGPDTSTTSTDSLEASSDVAGESADPVAPLAPPGDEAATHSLVLPALDPEFQASLNRALSTGRLAAVRRRGELSVVLIDLTDPENPRYAALRPDSMRYAASLPKIAVMLTVMSEVHEGRLEYTPALRERLEQMIRRSSNPAASELIRLVSFETIETTLRDPRYELYDPNRDGGLWVGRGYGSGVGAWRRDPIHSISHGATARQAARFLLMIERGELVSPWASAEMKRILGEPEIRHKFVRGLLDSRPLSRIFRKSGTWRNFDADAAIVERGAHKYIAVALLESAQRGVLAELITKLDALVIPPAAANQRAAGSPGI